MLANIVRHRGNFSTVIGRPRFGHIWRRIGGSVVTGSAIDVGSLARIGKYRARVYHHGHTSAVGDVLSGMQFGIFTVGDVTTDPTTGATPSEAERIRATVTIAKKAEEVELDVFATGEHHNPPFVPSSPTTLLGYIAAQTERLPARTEYEVGPVTIPAGARVLLSLGAANRDPQVFDDPDEFRVDRNPTEHIAFGFGAHLCLGAQLTRMEAQAVLRELVTRARRIEAIGKTLWSASYLLRGPERINVRLTPSVVAG